MGDKAKVNTAVIVRPGEPPVKALLEDHLEVYQDVVGGYIEGVVGKDVTMYVNEDGVTLGLPFNPRATLFARSRGAQVNLVGAALILGPLDDQGNATNVPQSVLNYFGLEDQ